MTVRPVQLVACLLGLALMPFAAARAAEPDAPARLVSMLPAANAANVCPDTQLHLTFSSPPVLLKTGSIEILDDKDAVVDAIDLSKPTSSKTIGGLANYAYYPVLITGNEAVIAFKNNVLAYDNTYHVKIPPGAFTDKQGHALDIAAAADWHFSTKDAPPTLAATGPRRLVVAADGSGDFATLQGALDFIPDGNNVPTTLLLRKGGYNEMVYVANKHNLTILGEDRERSILAYPANQKLSVTYNNRLPGGYRRGLFRAVNCNGLVLANFTLHNTTPQDGSQAESIILDGSLSMRAILMHMNLVSFQDTLQINCPAYVADSYIEGDVDFMWGAGPAYFNNCECKAVRSNAYYTQIRNSAANHGYVYDQCTFDGSPGVKGNFLSRIEPGRFPNSEVVLLNCTLTDAVGSVAWRLDRGTDAPSVRFWEFNSTDSAGKPIDDPNRLAISRRLDKVADADAVAHYANPTWVLGWTPTLAPIITAQPVADAAGTLKIEVAAVPPPAFQWQKDGAVIPGATEPAYKPSAPGNYAVVISNPTGTATSATIKSP